MKDIEELISEAVRRKVSHIHIEPEENSVHVRFRIDGMLHKEADLPKEEASAVIARFKTLCGMDVSQTQTPQQGQMEVQDLNGHPVVFSVSTCPTLHGENVVLTARQEASLLGKLDALGLSVADLRVYKNLIGSGCGMMLVAGPVGSGTTTTLYASLQAVDNGSRNIMAVEEEIVYRFAGIHQVVADARSGLSFGAVLRAFLQQDPDVILAGDIRDQDAAEIVFQAALTGRLVLSAMRADSAVAALSALLERDIDPFLVSSALLGILAQRLVRRLCPVCKEQYQPGPQLVRELGLENRKRAVYLTRGKGCPACAETGYKGWIGAYELLTITPAIQELILQRADSVAIRQQAGKGGMRTVRQAAIEKMLLGLTSPEEVLRVSLATD